LPISLIVRRGEQRRRDRERHPPRHLSFRSSLGADGHKKRERQGGVRDYRTTTRSRHRSTSRSMQIETIVGKVPASVQYLERAPNETNAISFVRGAQTPSILRRPRGRAPLRARGATASHCTTAAESADPLAR